VYQANSADGAHLGWVVPAGGQGFADRIDLLIGINADLSTITGMYVLDQKETPGLGNYIGDEFFEKRFADKRTDEPLVVVKGDPTAGSNQIKALTGATISSDSVATIVNNAIADVKKPLQELKTKSEAAPQKTPGQETVEQETAEQETPEKDNP
jgi:electron transport complex protein RnfG